MATYVIADIHGDMKAFEKMLEKIEFTSGKDFLIVNGDVLDRGDYGLEVLFLVKDMVDRQDAIFIKGNHEMFAQMFLEGRLTEKDWSRYYGEHTMKSIKKLDDEKKRELLEYIKKLPLYMELDIPKYKKTVIIHTGLMNDYIVTYDNDKIDVTESIKKACANDEYSLLISADIHYWRHEQLEKMDKFIICGHVPTYQLGQEYTGKILKTRKYMNIDAGAGYRDWGGRLACYSIDEDKEFYV